MEESDRVFETIAIARRIGGGWRGPVDAEQVA
jgi:hypothetical protein